MDGPSTPAVVLVRPREEGNVGSAARAMANMGLDRLILVEPAAEIGKVGIAFAVGARHVLDGARRVSSLREALAPFRRIVGTTSSRDRRWEVPVLTPRELPAYLAAGPAGHAHGAPLRPRGGGADERRAGAGEPAGDHPLLAGPADAEPRPGGADRGLRALPGARARGTGDTPPPASVGRPEPPATTEELDGLFDHAADVLRRVGFERDDSFAGVLRDLRRLAARAGPTSREVAILRGICRRTQRALERE